MPEALIATMMGKGILQDELGHEIQVAYEIDVYEDVIPAGMAAEPTRNHSQGLKYRAGRILVEHELTLSRLAANGRFLLVFDDGRRLPITLKSETLSRWVFVQALGDFI